MARGERNWVQESHYSNRGSAYLFASMVDFNVMSEVWRHSTLKHSDLFTDTTACPTLTHEANLSGSVESNLP